MTTPAVAFCMRAIKTTRKQVLYDLLDESPMATKDYAFIADIIEGLDNTNLAIKYKKSASRISQWKRRVFEELHRFMIAQDKKKSETENTLSSVEKHLSVLEKQISELERHLSVLEKQISDTEKHLSVTEKRLSETDKRLSREWRN